MVAPLLALAVNTNSILPPDLIMAAHWVSGVVRAAVRQQVSPQAAAVFVLNATEICRQTASLKAAFPASAIHAFACKANPLTAVLKLLADQGMACETASLGEFTTACRFFGASKVVFDSPVKTNEELCASVVKPCFLNVDNFQELERIAQLHASLPVGEFRATVGIRINPQIGAGSIDALSTGRMTSKFGIGLEDQRDALIAAYVTYPWLTMVHVHTGSQGLPIDLMIESIQKIYAFLLDLQTVTSNRINFFDIGGGLSVNFSSDAHEPSFAYYGERLRAAVPELFAPHARLTLITEMGRSIVSKAGVYLSRVEYTKVNGGRHIVSQHCGHDLLLRSIWCPKDWPLRVHIFNGTTGEERSENVVITDVAGPCCLGGDLACKERPLPEAFPGDIVVIRDVGGYYHVSYNYYNLRPAPPAFMFHENHSVSGTVVDGSLQQVHRGRTVAETLAFFECDVDEKPAVAA